MAERAPEHGDGASLAWGWVAAGAIAVCAAAVLLGALLLTPGTPDCRLYNPRAWVLCPWYRQYVGTAVAIALSLVVVLVPVGLLIGAVRAIVQR